MADKEIEFVKKKQRNVDFPICLMSIFLDTKEDFLGKWSKAKMDVMPFSQTRQLLRIFRVFVLMMIQRLNRLLMCLKLNFIDGNEFKSGNLNVDRNNGSQIPRGCACAFDYLGISNAELEQRG